MNISNLYLDLNNIIINSINNELKLVEIHKFFINGYISIDDTENLKFHKSSPTIRLYCIKSNTNSNKNKKNLLLYSGYNNNDYNSIKILKYFVDCIFDPIICLKYNQLLSNIFNICNIYFIIIGSPLNYLFSEKAHLINHSFEPIKDFFQLISSNPGYNFFNHIPFEFKYFNIPNDIYIYNIINNINFNYNIFKLNYFKEAVVSESSNNSETILSEKIQVIDILFDVIQKYKLNHIIFFIDKEINELYSTIENNTLLSNDPLKTLFYDLFYNSSNIFIDDNKYFINKTNNIFENKYNIKKTILCSNNSNNLEQKFLMILYLIIRNY